MTYIIWFRQDLRLTDNPALAAAARAGAVLPVFILEDPETGDGHQPGSASRWWLHHSLAALQSQVPDLVLLRGDPRVVLPDLATRVAAKGVCWNRCYDPHAVRRDGDVKAALTAAGLEVRSFNGALLAEPWEIETGAGGPFKVFSPFWKVLRHWTVGAPIDRPETVRWCGHDGGLDLAELDLLPKSPNWAAGWEAIWSPGEDGAASALQLFLSDRINGYSVLRDRPDLENVSRLSPHLHFGEVSPRQVWTEVRKMTDGRPSAGADADKFLSELAWREFSHHLLYHFPHLPDRNWKPAFDAYPWRQSDADLRLWQNGQTGYPIVDAGMRELWQTGYMHNRVRMIAASFLVKHLRIDWREGEAWFRDTLVDADLANNSAGWQWVAGSGADAAPYFRVFNPVVQGRKFDPDGRYVRRWLPELDRLETAWIHAPFEAPEAALTRAGVMLGETYAAPMVDHAAARKAALDGYEAVRRAGGQDA